jgi:hypothetical protein
VLAQRMLFFEHTSSGDLTGLLCEFFDTTIGPKREATSYTAIAAKLGSRQPTVVLVALGAHAAVIHPGSAANTALFGPAPRADNRRLTALIRALARDVMSR